MEQDHQKEVASLKNELAAKDDEIANCKKLIALQEERLKKVDKLTQWASRSLRDVSEREHDLARQEYDIEQREQLLHRDLEAIVDYRVDEDIKNIRKGFDYEWGIIKRKTRNIAADEKECNNKSASLDKRELEMLERATLIADHLGVPLKCILNPREKKLVSKITNELPKERYALIDLVMSCPDAQVKALLAAIQQVLQS